MDIINNFLLEIGKRSRVNRKSFWEEHDYSIRQSEYQGQKEAGVWFRTRGCSYDYQGGCIMCDYSIGQKTDSDEIIRYVEEGLKQISDPCYQLLVSPSGSMLDEKEVPRLGLEGILKLLADSPHERFSFETRVDSVSEEKIDFCKRYLGNRFYRLFIGLESANEWVLKYCINKQLSVSQFVDAVNILKSRGVRTAANIIISVPFLSDQENIDLAVSSVKWAVRQGCGECFLFPLHVKSATPLSTLNDIGMFKPPKLWQLVEIINRLGPDYYKYLRLSWYTSYNAFNVISSPQTCPDCMDQVIKLLDHFAEYQDEESIIQLNAIECDCKVEWYASLQKPVAKSIPERVFEGYRVLSEQFMKPGWWEKHSEELYEQLTTDAFNELFEDDSGKRFKVGST